MLHEDLWNYYSVLEYNNVFGKEDRRFYIFDIPYFESLRYKRELEKADDALPATTTTTTAVTTKESDDEEDN